MNKTTKKISIIFALSLSALLVSATSAKAATFELSPANFVTTAGTTFTVNVALNPEAVKSYTAKMELNFPANVLKVNSFTLANGWVAITSPGYTLVDNTNGLLIETGGYPSGITSTTNFGTISFTALQSGSASISVNSASMILGSSGQNLLTSGIMQSSVTVKPAPTTTQGTSTSTTTTTTTNTTPSTSTLTPGSDTTTQNQPTSTANQSAPNPGQANLLNGVKNVLSLGTGQTWLAILVALIIIGAGWYGYNYYAKNNQPKK